MPTGFPMNCSLTPSDGDILSFLQGPIKEHLTSGYHGVALGTHKTLTVLYSFLIQQVFIKHLLYASYCEYKL